MHPRSAPQDITTACTDKLTNSLPRWKQRARRPILESHDTHLDGDMHSSLLISFVGPDRPGMVEQLAGAISSAQGNWLESSMSSLAGHFAGIVRVSLPQSERAALDSALEALADQQLQIQVYAADSPAGSQDAAGEPIHVSIVGIDRPGIIHEVSQAFVWAQLNIARMTTEISSAPMSGESLFHSDIALQATAELDLDELERKLDAIASTLSVEIDLSVDTA